MAEYYTKTQSDSQATVIGARIKAAVAPATLKTNIEGLSDTNFLTDAEKTKLAGLESSKFLGVFTSLGAVPTVGASAGSYANVDAGGGSDVQLAVYDVEADAFIIIGGAGSETASSVKTKYESNADTNAFTDAEKTKLAGIVEATGITDFTAALDAALA